MKPFLSILLSTIWISVNEFFRNEFLLKSHWDEHYSNLGLTFPGEPINGAVWRLWSLAFALGIYVISRRFSFLETTGLAWVMGFVLMWLVTGNMLVLPFSILPFAVPLSILETAGSGTDPSKYRILLSHLFLQVGILLHQRFHVHVGLFGASKCEHRNTSNNDPSSTTYDLQGHKEVFR